MKRRSFLKRITSYTAAATMITPKVLRSKTEQNRPNPTQPDLIRPNPTKTEVLSPEGWYSFMNMTTGGERIFAPGPKILEVTPCPDDMAVMIKFEQDFLVNYTGEIIDMDIVTPFRFPGIQKPMVAKMTFENPLYATAGSLLKLAPAKMVMG